MKKTISLVIGMYLLIAVSPLLLISPADAAIPAMERQALIDLYNSTAGASWADRTNWNGAPGTECTWHGVYCSSGDRNVADIILWNNNLIGTIPATLQNLTSLEALNLGMNRLSGAIPPELGNLANLRTLDLRSNQLTGAVPASLGNLALLRFLSISSNQLTSLPAELGNLSNLGELSVSYNALSGPIPPWIGNLTELTGLYLSNDRFSDSIPPEIGNLKKLMYLDLSVNRLTGPIPAGMGNLANLIYLSLGNNQLSGAIPPEIYALSNLQFLALGMNRLTGEISPQVGNLVNLQGVMLYGNQLTGPIPPEIGNLTNLFYLMLDNNQLTGSIPASIGNLTKMYFLYLSVNQLTGSIPREIGNLRELRYAIFSNNQLSGPISPELGNCSKLIFLDLSNNNFTSMIPDSLGSLSELQVLGLFRNRLSGAIPPSLGNLSKLRNLVLLGNNLVGPIPSTLMNLQALARNGLIISYNGLYTSDPALMSFLSTTAVDPTWATTQTVAPANVAADLVTDSTVSVGWTPIVYTADTGGYEVHYSLSPAGCYSPFGTTPDKLASSMTVTGLMSGTPYYFKIRTFTNSHANNNNTVTSDFSPAIAASTTGTAPASTARTDVTNESAGTSTPFGSSNVNVATSARVLTITNTGVNSMDITDIALGGTNPSEFTLDLNGGASPCGSAARSLAPGANCTVSVAFLPKTAGGKGATLNVASNAVNNCGGVVGHYLSGDGTKWAGNHAPSAPVLATPENGQGEFGTSVECTWWRATDADGDTLSYQIAYCTNEFFSGCMPENVATARTGGLHLAGIGGMGLLLIGSILITDRKNRMMILMLLIISAVLLTPVISACSRKSGGAGIASGPQAAVAGDMSFVATGLSTGTIYFWKIIVDDGKGGTAESAVRSFRTN